jgi:hypothetical protein
MKEQIEDFIRRNRQELDDKKPSKKVWNEIESAMGFETSTVNWSATLFKAAAILLLVLSGWLLYDKLKMTETPQVGSNLVVNGQSFDEIESFYTMVIEKKMFELQTLSSDRPDILTEFAGELEALDSMYIVLRNDLKYGNQEQILDAMILNLQLRLEILNQQSEVLKKLKNYKENEEFI